MDVFKFFWEKDSVAAAKTASSICGRELDWFGSCGGVGCAGDERVV